jgi:hypothetical protein
MRVAAPPEDPERELKGFWRAVLVALESNSKTARLVVILMTMGLVIAVGARASAFL